MIILGMILAYLIGSIPTAYIFGRLLKNIDIREHGSGNVGATNVFRVLGKGPGATVLILDILKGVVAVLVGVKLFSLSQNMDLILLSIAVVCGHNWTVFLQFKGGKGIATTLGVLIAFTIQVASIRPVLALTLLAWIVCFVATGFVSLSSMVAATVLPIVMVITAQPFEFVCIGAVFCVFVVIRHKPNITRLLNGAEPKVPLPFTSKDS